MKANFARLSAAALAVLLTTGTVARADLVHWSYSWSNSPTDVLSDSGNSKITLTDQSLQQIVGDSDIVSTNLRTSSNASASNPDTFTNKAYLLSLTITDDASGMSGTVQFGGVFNGTVSSASANIANTFAAPTTQTIVLGDNLYTISLPFYTPPGPPNATNSGSISAHVTVQLVQDLPEPRSLALAGIGMTLVVLVSLGRRRFPLLPA